MHEHVAPNSVRHCSITASCMSLPMQHLPNDLIRNLFTYLTITEAFRLSSTCSAFQRLLAECLATTMERTNFQWLLTECLATAEEPTPSQWVQRIFAKCGFDKLDNTHQILSTRGLSTVCEVFDRNVPLFCGYLRSLLQEYSDRRAVYVAEEKLEEEFQREKSVLAATYGFGDVSFVDLPLQRLEDKLDKASRRIAARSLIPKLEELLKSPQFPKHKHFQMFDLNIRGIFPLPSSTLKTRISLNAYKRQHPPIVCKNGANCLNIFISQPIQDTLADFNTPVFAQAMKKVDKMEFCKPERDHSSLYERQYLADCRALRDGLGLADVSVDFYSSSAPGRMREDVQKLREGKLQAEVEKCDLRGAIWFYYTNNDQPQHQCDPYDGVCQINASCISRSVFPPNDKLRDSCLSTFGNADQTALFCRALNALENLVNEVYHPIPISFRPSTDWMRDRTPWFPPPPEPTRVDYARFLMFLLVGWLRGLAPRDLSQYMVEHVILATKGLGVCDNVRDGEMKIPLAFFERTAR